MADKILFSYNAVSQARRKLDQVAVELASLAKQLQQLDIPDDAGSQLKIGVSGMLGGGIAYSGNTVEACIRSIGTAMSTEADYVSEICERLKTAEQLFEMNERSIADGITDIGAEEQQGDAIVSKHVTYFAAGTAPVLGASASNTSGLPLSNDDAQDLINFFLGDGMVSQFIFWYSADDKVEKYWKVLTGETKGMTQAEVNAALAEFVLIAKLMNSAVAHNQVDKLQGVINSLSDWASETEKNHNKDQILSFAKETLGLSVEKAIELDIDLEAVTVGTLTLLTAKEFLIDVPQAQYAESILNRLEKTGQTNVTIDMVINNKASAKDLELESTVSNSNKKKAKKYAQMLYDIEKSLN